MKIEITRKKREKGAMSRRLVCYCVTILTLTAIWAAVLKTYDRTVDLTDVLTFVGAAFGGELLMLLCKRVFTKDKEETE